MQSTIYQILEEGVTAHKEGRVHDAKRLYRSILESQPAHPEANHNLGVLAISINEVKAALPLFKTALEGNFQNEQFWLSYIEALIIDEQFDNARQILKQAREQGLSADSLDCLEDQLLPKAHNPDTAQVHPPEELLDSLVSHYQSGRLSDAERLAVEITQDFPQHQLSWKVLGAVLGATGRKSEAIDVNKTAVALSPHDPVAHSNLGVMLEEVGRLDEAEASYKKAIEVKRDYADAHYNLGVMLQELGRLDEAEASYKQAIVSKPDYADAHYNLGIILQELGRLEEAGASYTQAILFKPDHAEAHNNLGSTLRELGRLGEAEVSYNHAIAAKPDHAQAHYNLGNTLEELGKMEDSVSSFQKAFVHRTGIPSVGDNVLAPATTSIFFELTNKCNFHCTFCPSDDQKRSLGFMDLGLIKQLYQENADRKIANKVHLHLMGEPTLHPALTEILRFGASKNVETDLVTNISTLNEKNIPKVLNELYGTLTASHMTPTEETYHFRGKVGLSWNRYNSNLRMLVREYMKRLAKGNAIKNDITIRVMVTQNTASNVSIIATSNEASAILKEWNDFVAEVEEELKMSPFERKDHNTDDPVRGNNHASTSYLLQHGIKLTFWRAFTFANTRVSNEFDLKTTRKTSYCSHPFTDIGVLWNGDVTLCCLDHDGELKVGNVRDASMETVIQSEAAQKLRASMLGDYPLPSICQTCQERPVKRDQS